MSWNLAGAIMTNGIRVVVIAVLGRALTSADFGVVAAAISVNVILYSIRDIGLARALIQRENLDEEHLKTGFAVSTYIGLALMALLFFTAPLIGRLYNISASVNVIRVLAIQFATGGITTTSRVVCERSMNFRAVAMIDAGSFAAGAVASMVFAVSGFGPWSLVIGYLVEDCLSTMAYLITSPPKVSFRVDRGRLRELMTFGTGQTITQICAYLAVYGDNVVVGKVLGASALGFYTRAYDLIKFPSMVFEAIVGKVLFPAFSRFQKDRKRLAVVFHRVMFANALVLLPASALLVVVAPEVIRILVGKGWDSSVLPLRILAFTILPRTSQKLGIIVTQAAGRSNSVAIANAIYMIFVIGGALISIRWGIPGVATSTSIAIAIVFGQCCYLAMRVCEYTFLNLIRAHLPGFALAGLVAGMAIPITSLLRSMKVSPPIVLVVVATAAASLCLAMVAIWLRRGRGDFGWLREEIHRLRRSRTPARISPEDASRESS